MLLEEARRVDSPVDYRHPRASWLYRLYAADGELLYVGITMRRPFDRWISHMRKPWWGRVHSVTLTRYDHDTHALLAEMAAIRDERPTHNKRGARLTEDSVSRRVKDAAPTHCRSREQGAGT